MPNVNRILSLMLVMLLFSCSQPSEQDTTEVANTDANAVEQASANAPNTAAEQGSGVLLQKWKEGVHYTIYNDEATTERKVQEYFSFWCPACYGFEPIVDMIKSGLDDDVAFEKVHVYFMPFTTPEIQNEASRAMVIATSLGQSDKFNAAIFDHIHKQRKSIEGLGDLRALFVANGMSGDDFDAAASGSEVEALLQQNNDQIEQNRELVTGVPTFLVNGKYKPMFNRDMTVDDIVELVKWLSMQN
jgi:thiol:disulfide interchange protein DsbA